MKKIFYHRIELVSNITLSLFNYRRLPPEYYPLLKLDNYSIPATYHYKRPQAEKRDKCFEKTINLNHREYLSAPLNSGNDSAHRAAKSASNIRKVFKDG